MSVARALQWSPSRPLGLAVIAGLLASIAVTTPGFSEVRPGFKPKIDAALAAFMAQEKTGKLPRYADAAAQDMLDTFWDGAGISGSKAMVGADIPALLDIMDKELHVLRAYLYFAEPGNTPNAEENSFTFQDEVARSTAVQFDIYRMITEAANDFWHTLPQSERTEVRRQGVAQIASGVTESLTGAFQMIGSPGLRPDNRLRIVKSLQRFALMVPLVVDPAQRAQLAKSLQAALTAIDATTRNDLAPMSTALASTDCSNLCAIYRGP